MRYGALCLRRIRLSEMLKDLIKYAGVSISEHTATDFQATIAKTAQVEPDTEQPAAEQAPAPLP